LWFKWVVLGRRGNIKKGKIYRFNTNIINHNL